MIKRKIILHSIGLFTISLLSYSVWNLYYILPTAQAKPEIQIFLDKNFDNKFKIVTIDKLYSRDLFKQPVGYKLILSDTNHIQFGNIFIQFNKYQQGWITYGGSDIEKEYETAKKH